MPDTELMDQVMEVITAVPTLHNQRVVGQPLWRFSALEQVHAELAAAPDVARRLGVAEIDETEVLLSPCGSAHCFGGWALVLRGYRHDRATWHWTAPGGRPVYSPLMEAAQLLGIRYDEAYSTERRDGIFWEDNNLEDLAHWVAYYKGELDRDDLEFRLGLKRDA